MPVLIYVVKVWEEITGPNIIRDKLLTLQRLAYGRGMKPNSVKIVNVRNLKVYEFNNEENF